MSIKELISHGFVIKEYGYDLYSVAKAYNQLPEDSSSSERKLYFKDLKRYSHDISNLAEEIEKIIATVEAEEMKNEKRKIKKEK